MWCSLRLTSLACGLSLVLGCAAGTGAPSPKLSVLQADAGVASAERVPGDADHESPKLAAPPIVTWWEITRLMEALDGFPGCLGTQRAITSSGKLALFAWFENKAALLKWYYSQAHQEVMAQSAEDRHHDPLAHVPDDAGPILVITSITVASGARLLTGEIPLSQIAIELYEPLPGGHYIGERFAPLTVKIPHSIKIADP